MENVRVKERVYGEEKVRSDSNTNEKTGYEILKKVFDFISSLLVSIILIIPCFIIAAVIFITDPGNPFFVQERVGKDGKAIKIVKFRSMKKNADDLKNMLTAEEYERYKVEFKLDNDPRLLPHNVGKYIRKFSIDEFPQIMFNICIKGDMSVIGPRPVLRDELEMNYTPEEQRLLTSAKPGLTGYWQAYGRNDICYQDGKRQQMELYYVENKSIRLDLKILLQTVKAVITQNGAK